MTISTIRAIENSDLVAIKKSAEKFCIRHSISPINGDFEIAIKYEIDCNNDKKIESLWLHCFCRALQIPFDRRATIAYGYIGLSI